MTLTFKSGDIVAGPVTDLTVGLGRKFVLTIGRVRPGTPIHWTTENDPVLDLRESPDRLSAKVTATGLGRSIVFITAGGFLYRLVVDVVPKEGEGEAVKLNGKIGEEEPDV